MPTNLRRIQRALISVHDKEGLLPFAAALAERGVALISTGGTRGTLLAGGLPVFDVAEVTGFPEIMDGRVKTLHPRVHGGLLARREHPEHQAALLAHGIPEIDLLVVNLYPFERTVASGASEETAIEMIDIGGPAMLRAGAKNHDGVTVVTDTADYAVLLDELRDYDGRTSYALRRRLAAKAFALTARYDTAVARWFAADDAEAGGGPGRRLRYGENPHQQAWLVPAEGLPGQRGIVGARQVQGKALSYNNIADADAALRTAAEFDPARTAAVAIVKHANPCGVAEAATLEDAYRAALRCDPVSAFGGIIAVNRPLDGEAARAMVEIFTEVIVAPDADAEALAVIAARKNLRLLLTGGMPDPRAPEQLTRSVLGGALVQTGDNAVVDDMALKVVTRRGPDPRELADLLFAFRVAKHVRSNAIVYARDGATVGIGAGQMSRVDSARIAAWKAAEAAKQAGLPESLARGSVVASDAFFPFADGLIATVEAGATAVIQPGGSMRDQEVIDAADEAGIAMVFTGVRHFRH